jgi:hypothetical protein
MLLLLTELALLPSPPSLVVEYKEVESLLNLKYPSPAEVGEPVNTTLISVHDAAIDVKLNDAVALPKVVDAIFSYVVAILSFDSVKGEG